MLMKFADELRERVKKNGKSKQEYWQAVEMRMIFGIPDSIKEVCDGDVGGKTKVGAAGSREV